MTEAPEIEAVNRALRAASPPPPRPSRRQRRAERNLAELLSPAGILLRLMSIPVVTLAVTLSVYLRTSPYEPPEAMLHLVALAGCDAARSVGLAPAARNTPGYHPRNDPDGDGVACEQPPGRGRQAAAGGMSRAGGAKFVRLQDRVTPVR